MSRSKQADRRSKPPGGNGDAAGMPARVSSTGSGARRARKRPQAREWRIPKERRVRDLLRRVAARYVEEGQVIPPLTMEELCAHAERVLQSAGVEALYRDYTAIVVSNEAWRETVARIPHHRRLLLLPKCLRVEEHCPGRFDELGLLCKGCGLCSIHDLSSEAESLGYAVLVAEGSAVVSKMIETGRVEAVIGVSCINVLEKCFGHMASRAVPGLAIPLLHDGCSDTAVDLDWVREAIHLSAEDKTYRLNLESVRREVDTWFGAQALTEIMGRPGGETDQIARDWLAAGGKRWRPFLSTCVCLALGSESIGQRGPVPTDAKRLAVAIECFHKASLVHDDIEDEDQERYGHKTLHARYGVAVALNVGDFLLGEGYRLIGELDLEARKKVAMLGAAAEAHVRLCRGQGAELCWARRPRPLSVREVLDIFRHKTAPAFEVALRLGAYYCGADRSVHRVLKRYSECLGIAYQIRDDVEDFTGRRDRRDPGDLRPSVILALAYQRAAGSEAELIASLWDHKRRNERAAEEVRALIRDRGVVDKASELMEAYQEEATRSLRLLKNTALKGLLQRVVGKIFGEDPVEGYCRECEAGDAAGGEVRAEPAA